MGTGFGQVVTGEPHAQNFDPLFVLPIDFPGFVGVLDKQGAASMSLYIPYFPWLKGVWTANRPRS